MQRHNVVIGDFKERRPLNEAATIFAALSKNQVAALLKRQVDGSFISQTTVVKDALAQAKNYSKAERFSLEKYKSLSYGAFVGIGKQHISPALAAFSRCTT